MFALLRYAIFTSTALVMIAMLWKAQAAQADYVVPVGQALSSAIVLVFAALSGALSWLIALVLGRIAKKFGLEIRNEVRIAIDGAAQEGLRWARNKALEAAARLDEPRVRSEIVANAAAYVLGQFPKLVQEARLTEDGLRHLVYSHLPAVEAAREPGSAG